MAHDWFFPELGLFEKKERRLAFRQARKEEQAAPGGRLRIGLSFLPLVGVVFGNSLDLFGGAAFGRGGLQGLFFGFVGLLVALPAMSRTRAIMRASLRRQLAARERCVECGYSLTGNISGVCPECGHRVATVDRPE